MDTILLCDELQISFPSTDTELQTAAEAFKSISSHGVVDRLHWLFGWHFSSKFRLLQLKKQGMSSHTFQASYQRDMESMYKQLATINVDSSVSALLPPVALTSIAAFRKTPLQKNVHELPLGKYIIGDNATSVLQTC
jgi:hypothetical protein